MCSRAAFLRFAAVSFPALLLFLLAAYGAPAYITALGPEGWVRFLSRRGCTQGCPLGPLCFAAALQDVLRTVRDAHPDCLVVALHDDVQIAGPVQSVHRATTQLISLARAQSGLTPTGHKFALYLPGRDRATLAPVEAASFMELEGLLDRWTPP